MAAGGEAGPAAGQAVSKQARARRGWQQAITRPEGGSS